MTAYHILYKSCETSGSYCDEPDYMPFRPLDLILEGLCKTL